MRSLLSTAARRGRLFHTTCCVAQAKPHIASVGEPVSWGTVVFGGNFGKLVCAMPAYAGRITLGDRNIGQFYEVTNTAFQHLNLANNLPENYKKQVDTFSECLWMCRSPTIASISLISQLSPGQPTPRTLFFGHRGTGKSLALLQAMHYAYLNNWVIVHVPKVRSFTRTRREKKLNKWDHRLLDTPIDCVEWLTQFRLNNTLVEETLESLVLEKDVVWSEHETTHAGTSIKQFVDFGFERVTHSTDVCGILLEELKRQSSEQKIKLFVSIDQVNSLFWKTRFARADDMEQFHDADDVSMVRHLKNLLKDDWSNGAIFMALNEIEFIKIKQIVTPESYLPLYLLGYQGFSLLDPFLPVEVPNYSQKEASLLLDYFTDKHWLNHPDAFTQEGRNQIMHVNAHNPHMMERFCAAL